MTEEKERPLHWFENEEEGCKFAIYERPTGREQFRYMGMQWSVRNDDRPQGYWICAQPLIVKWECEKMPSKEIDLDGEINPSSIRIMTWAGVQVFSYMNSLEDIPKN